MTDAPKPETPPPQAKVPPETLELRARPAPVTTINRKVLIGGAAIVLMMIAGIVLIALQPPTFRTPSGSELYNVDHKPTADGLSKLPATYEGVQVPQPAARQRHLQCACTAVAGLALPGDGRHHHRRKPRVGA